MSSASRILLIGTTGRTDCLAEAFLRSCPSCEIFALSEVHNPGLIEKGVTLRVGPIDHVASIVAYAAEALPDLAFLAQEQPIAAGAVEALHSRGVPCVAPSQKSAQIETSKSFARRLIASVAPDHNPAFCHFRSADGVQDYMARLGEFVVKADGLAGGKGVKVYGEHFHSIREAMSFVNELLECHAGGVVIEEKLQGEEFSLQSFCDGRHILHSPPVQDHKRAYVGDQGPMTGGMGSYACFDHSLPFLSPSLVRQAESINERVFMGLLDAFDEGYRGILYGNFIVTVDGLKVIEYNARFGDPEVMNVLPIMRTDFMELCEAIVLGRLHTVTLNYDSKSTVCKWVVPNGYPTNPVREAEVDPSSVAVPTDSLRVYYGAVDSSSGAYRLVGSRAIAFLGIADALSEAEAVAERAASSVRGPVFHREDIGTLSLVQKRVQHMLDLGASVAQSN